MITARLALLGKRHLGAGPITAVPITHIAVLCHRSSVTRRNRLGRGLDIMFLATIRAHDLEILCGQIL
jgi:hypothetical protein